MAALCTGGEMKASMRGFVSSCLFLGLVIISVNVAGADELAARMQQAYDAQCNAAVKGDYDAFAATMAGDFYSTDPVGNRSTRDEVVESVKGLSRPPTSVFISQCSTKILSISRHGNVITAVVRQVLRGKKITAHQGPVPIVASYYEEDLWSSAAVPIELSSKGLSDSLKLNGKTVQQQSSPPSRP